MVIAAGGDGTVNDVIQALAGYRTALGVLPMGTVNVWAREMGIGLTAADARETLLHGVRRRMDLGRANQRYFLMMAGIGLDAEAARRVEHGRLKRFGLKLLEYVATVGMLSITHHSDAIRITIGTRKRSEQALMVIIGNTRLYGGAMTFTRRAVADDGALDVVVIGSGGIFHRINVLGRALLRAPTVGPRVRYERVQRLRLESKRPVPVQVDGEVIGYLPMTFSVAPQALSVIVPRHTPAGLFSRAPEATRHD
jgi:YegS/Rv2252/BmrU family lipid kinase